MITYRTTPPSTRFKSYAEKRRAQRANGYAGQVMDDAFGEYERLMEHQDLVEDIERDQNLRKQHMKVSGKFLRSIFDRIRR